MDCPRGRDRGVVAGAKRPELGRDVRSGAPSSPVGHCWGTTPPRRKCPGLPTTCRTRRICWGRRSRRHVWTFRAGSSTSTPTRSSLTPNHVRGAVVGTGPEKNGRRVTPPKDEGAMNRSPPGLNSRHRAAITGLGGRRVPASPTDATGVETGDSSSPGPHPRPRRLASPHGRRGALSDVQEWARNRRLEGRHLPPATPRFGRFLLLPPQRSRPNRRRRWGS